MFVERRVALTTPSNTIDKFTKPNFWQPHTACIDGQKGFMIVAGADDDNAADDSVMMMKMLLILMI